MVNIYNHFTLEFPIFKHRLNSASWKKGRQWTDSTSSTLVGHKTSLTKCERAVIKNEGSILSLTCVCMCVREGERREREICCSKKKNKTYTTNQKLQKYGWQERWCNQLVDAKGNTEEETGTPMNVSKVRRYCSFLTNQPRYSQHKQQVQNMTYRQPFTNVTSVKPTIRIQGLFCLCFII